ncbi:MAG: NUDIX domain-containing protein [Clostridia bacterium]|nr:NUDIX domain-containing protein [Clostridia bacterium]
MEEKLDVYTRDGKYLGVRTRTECHTENPGFYHKPAWTWAYNSKGEILVQKRSMQKKKFPGLWDMACAGHVEAGESAKMGAIREAKEELGIDVSENEMQFMFEYIEDDAWEIGQVFFFKLDKEAKEMTLQEEEVEEVKWVSFEEFKNLLYSDKWVPMDKKIKDLVVAEFVNVLK